MTDTAREAGAAPAVGDPLGHLGAEATLVEAFQATAAERPGQVALRTSDGAVSLTWAECAERVRLLPADWLPDGDELTPTMKMRRRVIESKYAATIEEMYA